MLKLYDYLASGNGYKVRLILNHLEIPFERIELDVSKGETRTPEFLAINPNGRIPTLQFDDGRALSESDAILWYFADSTVYLPTDQFERAQVLQWMFFEQYNHEPTIAVARSMLLHSEMTEDRKLTLKDKQEKGYDALQVMEQHLANRSYLVGDVYSIADIALYAYTHVADEGGFDLSGFRYIRAWLQRVKSQDRHIPITQG
ncbi:MAG: glutathione S-transferase family protein [Gammaproteobacteria bacterium]|nr:glutathione S-transferase family protein [Gammaproteobacteria bacterium]